MRLLVEQDATGLRLECVYGDETKGSPAFSNPVVYIFNLERGPPSRAATSACFMEHQIHTNVYTSSNMAAYNIKTRLDSLT
jgi:hypothetical protein